MITYWHVPDEHIYLKIFTKIVPDFDDTEIVTFAQQRPTPDKINFCLDKNSSRTSLFMWIINWYDLGFMHHHDSFIIDNNKLFCVNVLFEISHKTLIYEFMILSTEITPQSQSFFFS